MDLTWASSMPDRVRRGLRAATEAAVATTATAGASFTTGQVKVHGGVRGSPDKA